MAPKFKTKMQVGKLPAAVIAASVAASMAFGVPLLKKWESGGKTHLTPYRDIAGIWTVCDGETRVKMRVYTRAECAAMTIKAYKDFGAGVLNCTPSIYDRREVVAAAILLSYNIGVVGYCKSTIARYFNAGDFGGACARFYMWNKSRVRGVRVVVQGLVNRRKDETRLCLEGLRE